MAGCAKGASAVAHDQQIRSFRVDIMAGETTDLPLVKDDFRRQSIFSAQILLAVGRHPVVQSEVVACAFPLVPQEAEVGVGTVGSVMAIHTEDRGGVESSLAGSLP